MLLALVRQRSTRPWCRDSLHESEFGTTVPWISLTLRIEGMPMRKLPPSGPLGKKGSSANKDGCIQAVAKICKDMFRSLVLKTALTTEFWKRGIGSPPGGRGRWSGLAELESFVRSMK